MVRACVLMCGGSLMQLAKYAIGIATAVTIGAVSLGAAGCLSIPEAASRADAIIADGSVTISRSMPPVAVDLPAHDGFGFLPGYGAVVGNWVLIDSKRGTINLMDGQKVAITARAAGVDKLKRGRYQLVLKQRNPLWYAPTSYFAARHLDVPAEGDRARFRRGALGDFVLFLDKDTPVHSGPVWTEDIGGLRVDESSLAKFYYLLNVGSTVEVR